MPAAEVAQPHDVSPKKADSPLFRMSFPEVLEDLLSRFILNLPACELGSMERIYFQCEQAHWFYEDFLTPHNPGLTHMKLRSFSYHLLCASTFAVPLIQQYVSGKSGNLNTAFDKFMKYKLRVPVCGAILLNKQWNKALLVKGWKSTTWTFPKGKINQEEPELVCAMREVHEETGFDASSLLAETTGPDGVNPDFIDVKLNNGHNIRLYIVPGVDDNYPFQTLTRKEISEIGWISLTDLPSVKSGASSGAREETVSSSQKFWHVAPFIAPLRKWIKANRTSHPRPPSGNASSDNSGPLNAAEGLKPEESVALNPANTSADLSLPADVSGQEASFSTAAGDSTEQLKALLGLGDNSQPSESAAQISPLPQSASHTTDLIAKHGDARSHEFLSLVQADRNAHQPGAQNISASVNSPIWTNEQAQEVKQHAQDRDSYTTAAGPSPAHLPPVPAQGPAWGLPSQSTQSSQSQAILGLLGVRPSSQGVQSHLPPAQTPPHQPLSDQQAVQPPHWQNPAVFQGPAPPPLPVDPQARALLNVLGPFPRAPQPPLPSDDSQLHPSAFSNEHPLPPSNCTQPSRQSETLLNLLSPAARQAAPTGPLPPQMQQQNTLLGLLGPQTQTPPQPPMLQSQSFGQAHPPHLSQPPQQVQPPQQAQPPYQAQPSQQTQQANLLDVLMGTGR